jgi:hypothetical protein
MNNRPGYLVASALALGLSAGAVSAAGTDLKALEQKLDVNPMESCQEAMQYYQEGDLRSAIEYADICKSEMEQMGQQMAATSFKDEVASFQGGELREQNAMGFMQIERAYTKDGKKIEVTMSSGKNANMMLMAMSVSGRKTRVGKHNGFVVNQGGENLIYVPVADSAFIFKSKQVDGKDLKKFAKEFLKGFES